MVSTWQQLRQHQPTYISYPARSYSSSMRCYLRKYSATYDSIASLLPHSNILKKSKFNEAIPQQLINVHPPGDMQLRSREADNLPAGSVRLSQVEYHNVHPIQKKLYSEHYVCVMEHLQGPESSRVWGRCIQCGT